MYKRQTIDVAIDSDYSAIDELREEGERLGIAFFRIGMASASLSVSYTHLDPVDKLLAGELARMFDIEAYFGNASVGTGGSMAEIDMDLVLSLIHI